MTFATGVVEEDVVGDWRSSTLSIAFDSFFAQMDVLYLGL